MFECTIWLFSELVSDFCFALGVVVVILFAGFELSCDLWFCLIRKFCVLLF